ncbi:spondin-1-like, partial [Osmerus eperlanus]|uniref:spondin-1-like n=1 Tax=Osmerus eperlanus TaxID=29151 RepID=UPI002E0E85DF
MAGAGRYPRVLLLQCFISTALCNTFTAFTEEPMDRAGKSDGYCSRIIRAQGTRKEGYNEFRLRVEGDPETYQPGSTYRVTLYASSPSYFRGFTLISVKEGREGDQDEDYAGNFQVKRQHLHHTLANIKHQMSTWKCRRG